MSCILQLEKVVAGYGNGPDILKGVDVKLNVGELKCIIGPNGAGKSTVLNAIAGVLKPRSGQIIFDGKKAVGIEVKIKNKLEKIYANKEVILSGGSIN